MKLEFERVDLDKRLGLWPCVAGDVTLLPVGCVSFTRSLVLFALHFSPPFPHYRTTTRLPISAFADGTSKSACLLYEL